MYSRGLWASVGRQLITFDYFQGLWEDYDNNGRQWKIIKDNRRLFSQLLPKLLIKTRYFPCPLNYSRI
nr:MAG TPA: calmodulin [Ackermannviridae sp.]